MTDDSDPTSESKKRGAKTVPDEAFISPDEPIVADGFRDALISPDEPLDLDEEESGTVVGMDGSTHHDVAGAGEALLPPDRVADILGAVSLDLRENGISGLRADKGASTFERNLRIYLAEYFSKFD
jgi:hypothetical protein